MTQMVTYRLADSLPDAVVHQLRHESDPTHSEDFQRLLDAGHGSCLLREPAIAHQIIEAWNHFDGDRYRLLAWVVMPNHVHLLIQPNAEIPLSRIIQSWKSFTSRKIAAWCAERKIPAFCGWQRDYWDRYIRDEIHFSNACAYIRENPVRAGLVQQAEDWPFSSYFAPTTESTRLQEPFESYHPEQSNSPLRVDLSNGAHRIDPNRNARWARLIAEELHRGGIVQAVCCPGSRNSPLVFALAAEFGEAAIAHVDERSAGFIAVGLARSHRPTVVCVTSGSALANLMPALAEADAAGLPLVVLSGDRPWELHHCGAPQTMPQRGLMTPLVREELALGEPTDETSALRALRAQVSRLAQRRDGPVHLNVPLRDPLPPLPDPTWQPPAIPDDLMKGRPGPWTTTVRPTIPSEMWQPAWLKQGLRGVMVAGPGNTPCPQVLDFADATRFPLLADAPSQLRVPGVAGLVTTGDALLAGPLGQESVELIIQVGSAPLTRTAQEWLARQTCPRVLLSPQGNLDAQASATLVIEGNPSRFLADAIHWCAPGDGPWAKRWQAAEAAARHYLTTTPLSWGEAMVVRSALAHAGFDLIHLASSMAVRHANLLAAADDRPIHSNRGVNGIDGTLGTFLGLCHGTREKGLLLCGDLAFLHDLPALASAHLASGAIVLINNGGGSIFDFLPVAQVPGYDRWIRASHGLTFAASAAQFGLTHHACRTPQELQAALDAAANDDRLHLVECHCQGLDPVTEHRALLRGAAGLS